MGGVRGAAAAEGGHMPVHESDGVVYPAPPSAPRSLNVDTLAGAELRLSTLSTALHRNVQDLLTKLLRVFCILKAHSLCERSVLVLTATPTAPAGAKLLRVFCMVKTPVLCERSVLV